MRLVRVLTAVALVAGLTTAASANNLVWFTATVGGGDDGSGSVIANGSPGADLALGCNTVALGPHRCEWNIKMMLLTDVVLANGDVTSWANDFFSTDDTKISAKSANYGNYPLQLPPGFLTLNGGGGGLVTGAVQGNFGFATQPNTVYNLLNFTVSKNKNSGDLNTDFIDSVIGVGAWAGQGILATIQFGSLPPVVGNPGTVLPGLVSIQNIPEPGTLALLGVGAMAFIRRRR